MKLQDYKKQYDKLSDKRNLEGKKALEKVKECGYALKYVPESKMTDEIILEAIRQDNVLQYVPESKMTDEIILEAIKQTGCALQYVPEGKMTDELILEAVKRDSWALQYIPESKMTDEIILEAVKKDGCTLQYIPESKMTDEIILKAIEQNAWALPYVPNYFFKEENECPHKDKRTYLELIQIEGCPQYIVKCETCGKKGVIYLIEGEEDWDCFLETKVKHGYCDNTDCRNVGEVKLKKVKMKDEFEGGYVYWCDECVERDSDFIDENS